MSDAVPYADIVILALVAGFILLRLRSVLGTKNDNDGPDFFTKHKPPQEPGIMQEVRDTVIQIDSPQDRQKPREEYDPFVNTIENEQQQATIDAIKTLDDQFNVTAFVDGATRAFEMVFDAFAKGDKPTLKMLLSDALYESFANEIDARSDNGSQEETTLVSVKALGFSDIRLNRTTATVTVNFESEQVSLTRDSTGAIISGDASNVEHVQDEWVFERDVTSKSPNWKIIET